MMPEQLCILERFLRKSRQHPGSKMTSAESADFSHADSRPKRLCSACERFTFKVISAICRSALGFLATRSISLDLNSKFSSLKIEDE
jgi:hypothetical protein